MGLPYEQFAGLLAAADFPPLAPVPAGGGRPASDLILQALRQRADFDAAQLRRQSAQVLAEAASRNLLPQVDLQVNAGLAALKESSEVKSGLFPFTRNQTGPSTGVSLTWQWPVHNRAARAALAQQQAALEQADLRVADLRNAIGAGVEIAAANLARALRQVREAAVAVDLYTRSVTNERSKNRLGLATLVDILTVNDLLLSSRSAQVSHQASLLTSLAQLRFESGTLLEPGGGQQALRIDRLLTLPGAGVD
jgi:outer membrane protein